ncbi:MAG: RNA-binding protein [Bacteroidetes bacterium]|nr:MAG: RNA-binding protein [Bacteroidota bacterium]
MKIKVSNIDRSTTAEELKHLFEEFGDVVGIQIGEMPDPGKETFSAILEMAYAFEAEEAIAELNGERIDGRILRVKEASQADIDENQANQPNWEEVEELLDVPDQKWEPIVRKRPPREGPPQKKKFKNRRPRRN